METEESYYTFEIAFINSNQASRKKKIVARDHGEALRIFRADHPDLEVKTVKVVK